MRDKPISSSASKKKPPQKKKPLKNIELNNLGFTTRNAIKRDKLTSIRGENVNSAKLDIKQNLQQIFDDEDKFKGVSNSFRATSTPHTSSMDILIDKPKTVNSLNKNNYQVKNIDLQNKGYVREKVIKKEMENDDVKGVYKQRGRGSSNKLLVKFSEVKNNETNEDVEVKSNYIHSTISDNKAILKGVSSKNYQELETSASKTKESQESDLEDDIPLINFILPSPTNVLSIQSSENTAEGSRKGSFSNEIKKAGRKEPRHTNKKVITKEKETKDNIIVKATYDEKVVRKKVEFIDNNTNFSKDEKIRSKKNRKPTTNRRNTTLSKLNSSNLEIIEDKKFQKRSKKEDNITSQKRSQINFVRDVLTSEPRSTRRNNSGSKEDLGNNSISRDSIKDIIGHQKFKKNQVNLTLEENVVNTKTTRAKTEEAGKKRVQNTKCKKIGRPKGKKRTYQKLTGKELLSLCLNGKDPIDLLNGETRIAFKVEYCY